MFHWIELGIDFLQKFLFDAADVKNQQLAYTTRSRRVIIIFVIRLKMDNRWNEKDTPSVLLLRE